MEELEIQELFDLEEKMKTLNYLAENLERWDFVSKLWMAYAVHATVKPNIPIIKLAAKYTNLSENIVKTKIILIHDSIIDSSFIPDQESTEFCMIERIIHQFDNLPKEGDVSRYEYLKFIYGKKERKH